MHGGRWRESASPGVAVIWVRTPDRDVLSERLAAEAPLPAPERRTALSGRAQRATLLPSRAVRDPDQHLVQQGKKRI